MSQRQDRGFDHATPSEISPRALVEGRRVWLQRVAAGALGSGLAAWAARDAMAQGSANNAANNAANNTAKGAPLPGAKSDLAGAVTLDKLTPRQDATSYNNYYEFGTDKADPARNAHTLKTRPWTVAVEGAIGKPKVYGLDDLLKLAPMEERIYRPRRSAGGRCALPWR